MLGVSALLREWFRGKAAVEGVALGAAGGMDVWEGILMVPDRRCYVCIHVCMLVTLFGAPDFLNDLKLVGLRACF